MKVSIIISTYNYAQYIIEAINSVLQQDYPKDKIEIIVVDDGSTDNTKEVLQNFIQNNTIQYYYQQNRGKASATYKAIQHATGKYIFNLDADDYFLQNKIKRTVEIFESDESIVHVGSPAKQIMPDSFAIETIPQNLIGKALIGTSLLKIFMENNMLFGGGSTYAARALALKQIKIPAEVDMLIDEFLILALLPFGNSFFLSYPLSVWRGHGSNYSLSAATKEMQMIKGKRLLNSSNAVLHYLENEKFDKKLIKIYRLKNLTNKLSYKETFHTKTIKDITNYAFEIFFRIKPKWKLLKKYHVLNRLIPTVIFNFLKSSLTRSNKSSLLIE